MAGGPEPILLSILLIVVGAKLGGEFAERLKQPAVLGELLIGILLGASLLGGYLGLPDFAITSELHHLEDAAHGGNETALAELGHFVETHGTELFGVEIISALATIGVILLLFEVGLESDVKELTKVGASSLLVAIIGVVASLGIGYAASAGLSAVWSPWAAAEAALPNNLLHLFMGATLAATSVGITARVLGDMGKLKTNETRIILGAAVIDDIAALIILAIVAALVDAALTGQAVDALSLGLIAVKAIGFLVVALVVGLRFVPQAYDALIERFKIPGFGVALSFSFALLMAYLATVFGLADIVGAFAAGLLLAQSKAAHQIFTDLRPLAAIFVSFFFVTLGMQVDLTALDGKGAAVLGIGIGLTMLAMIAKLACGFGVVKGANASKLVVGVGMSPRGEVGLIFALLGLETGLIAGWQYTTVILVVMLTTFITPIWLKKLGDRFYDEAGANPKAEDASHILDG